MRAMVLQRPGEPLVARELPRPDCGPDAVLIEVAACGVCRTDLHIVDGELAHPKLPLVLGHQIVGSVTAVGSNVTRLQPADRVGVPWIGWTCGSCRYCAAGQENLCERARFTGYDIDGGFAELAAADARYCLRMPDGYDAATAAPLLCAGAIGYRAYRMAGDPRALGIYGFGAAGHLMAQVAMFEGRAVYAFTRPGDTAGQAFATELGVRWAGDSLAQPPVELDAAVIFAPDGALVPRALQAVRKGGIVVCAGIHMSDIPSFPYTDLWGERVLRSVANLTAADGEALLALASRVPLNPHVERFPLAEANTALDRLRRGRITGAAVLVP